MSEVNFSLCVFSGRSLGCSLISWCDVEFPQASLQAPTLNSVAHELDSFDNRRFPDRCQQLVCKLRGCQDRLLRIVEEMLCELFPEEHMRAPRDYRVKFPDDVLHDSFPGQLWFAAECLAAGSSIVDRDFESDAIRPLAKALSRHIDDMREILKSQSLKNPAVYPEKSAREYELQLELVVLFSETLLRAKARGYITDEQIETCDPTIMFSLPDWQLFAPFRALFKKIRLLLNGLNEDELSTLEIKLSSSSGGDELNDDDDDDDDDVELYSDFIRKRKDCKEDPDQRCGPSAPENVATTSNNIIHRLFVCIAGIADQWQSTYPSDLRTVLKMVFHPEEEEEENSSIYEEVGRVATTGGNEEETGVDVAAEPKFGVPWVPDEECDGCSMCEMKFSFIVDDIIVVVVGKYSAAVARPTRFHFPLWVTRKLCAYVIVVSTSSWPASTIPCQLELYPTVVKVPPPPPAAALYNQVIQLQLLVILISSNIFFPNFFCSVYVTDRKMPFCVTLAYFFSKLILFKFPIIEIVVFRYKFICGILNFETFAGFESAFISGSHDLLGKWNPSAGLPMVKDTIEENKWYIQIMLPVGEKIQYRFFSAISEPRTSLANPRHFITHYEGSSHPREIFLSDESETRIILCEFGEFEKQAFENSGWLTCQNEVLLTIDASMVRFMHPQKLHHVHLKVGAFRTMSSYDPQFSVEENTYDDFQESCWPSWYSHFKSHDCAFKENRNEMLSITPRDIWIFKAQFFTTDESIFKVEFFSISDEEGDSPVVEQIGTAIVLTSALQNYRGSIKLPICDVKNKVVGSFVAELLIIKPITDIKQTLECGFTEVKKKHNRTMNIGHRGVGQSCAKPCTLPENTIASFKAATLV
ncbi:Lateral signaling target protein [Trichinella spiralis]|uniref:Lateral signaling target protein n=1 Tax=Trichinella spiralis TaxID=6334 RepID=A0ABR3KS06_TRISP